MSNARNLANLLGTGTQITTADIADGVFQANRNLIINGAMQVWQRGTSSFTTFEYHADRWETGVSGDTELTYSVARSTDTPNGYGYSMVFQVNTAESTFGSNLYASVRTKLEGQDLQGIAKGTSDAKSLTWSFWVKGSVTGTYVCELYDNDNTRQASKTYTIDSANTWEKKTLTFEPDTTGDFDNDANLSLWVFFGLGSGSTYSSGTNSEGVWASAVSANRFAGQNNTFIGTSSATLRITGVQLELGETATPFEHRSFGDELIRCQRYYQKSYPYTNYAGDNLGAGAHGFIPIDSLDDVNIHFMQTMRATPSLTTYRKNGTATSSAQRADNAGSYITITVSEVRDNSFHFNPGSSVSRRYRLHYIADAEL